MGGHWPGQVLYWGRQPIRLPVAMLVACFEIGCAPGRRYTHQASPSRKPRAHSVLRRDVISA
jgi:hypothetical protein